MARKNDFVLWIALSLCLCGPCRMYYFCCRRLITQDSYPRPTDYEDDDESEEEIRRRTRADWDEGLLESPAVEPDEDAITTVWEMMERSAYLYADSSCFGTRQYLGKQKTEDGFPKMIFGETEWTDYATAGQQMTAFGAGLRALGLKPMTPGVDLERTSEPHTLLIYEDTSQEWMTSMIGAHSQSLVVATSYATLGIEAVSEAMKECSTAAVVCNRKNVDEIQRIAPSVLKTIIYTNHYVDPKTASSPLPQTGRCRVISWEEVIELGEQHADQFPPTPPTPDMLAVIMYTSGSTGKPKGVMIPHASILASVGALKECFNFGSGESYIAYLPAAHIFEFCAEMWCLQMGAEIGFSDPRTITSKGAVRQTEDGDINDQPGWPNPPGGIQEFRPTLMVAVPIVWDTFKKTIEDGVSKQSCVVKWLFQVAYSACYYARKQGRDCPLFKLLVFKKISGMVGGRLRFGASGGGPISQDVQEFMSVVGGFPVIQGYALTESCCAGTLQNLNDPDPGCVGGPLQSVELKLRSCDGPEDPMDREGYPYLVEDEDHLGETCQGRGEVCIRGPSMSMGYFKQPDKTREAWPEGSPYNNGWFHTGDIAYWDSRGRLRIVDRLKNLVKLKGGEYIAVENMEKEYSTSPYVRSGVQGGLMCYGDGDLRRPVALVQANMQELKKWAAGAGLSDLSDEQICDHKDAQKVVLDSFKSCAKKLGGNEALVAIRLISGSGPDSGTASEDSPWTPENGCKTASNKLDRRAIQKAHPTKMAELKKAGA